MFVRATWPGLMNPLPLPSTNVLAEIFILVPSRLYRWAWSNKSNKANMNALPPRERARYPVVQTIKLIVKVINTYARTVYTP